MSTTTVDNAESENAFGPIFISFLDDKQMLLMLLLNLNA